MKVYCSAVVLFLAMGHALLSQGMKSYSNYDFVPGDKILFEDDFAGDQDGEFAAHWKLKYGQAVVNQVDGKSCMLITEGNYGIVIPRIKTETYLGNEFTVEMDFQPMPSGYVPGFYFLDESGDFSKIVSLGCFVEPNYFAEGLMGKYPVENCDETFKGKWHHAALAYKNGQMKIYLDQYRVLVIPDCGFQPLAVGVGGIATEEAPLTFTHFRVAEGGSMNMLNALLTDGKLVTHGIHFESGKATLKPESMGTLNQIAKILKDNPAVKLQVRGHTDSDGDTAANQKLSQERADAVKNQLVSMGIDGARLSTSGAGESEPISANDTPEGKANNRRVEFIKQ